jgi:dCTP diphosphatase
MDSDTTTTIASLKQRVREFVNERDWQQFHSPKNLVMALTIEAGELMEHFQWIGESESRAVADQPDRLAEVAEEVSDVFCYLLAIANELGIDLAESFRLKMIKNRQKYPVERYRGRFGDDDPSPVS